MSSTATLNDVQAADGRQDGEASEIGKRHNTGWSCPQGWAYLRQEPA